MESYKKCDFAGCNRKHEARGYCAGHYQQLMRGKALTKLPNQDKEQHCTYDGCVRKRYNGTLFCWGHVSKKRYESKSHCLISDCTYTRRSNGMCEKHYQTAHRFKLTLVQYQMILDAPCEICERTGNSCIDHDHGCCDGGTSRKCGECIRGVLCNLCNSAIGKFNDDKETLRHAIQYLSKLGF